jgi:hypothetical protein
MGADVFLSGLALTLIGICGAKFFHDAACFIDDFLENNNDDSD